MIEFDACEKDELIDVLESLAYRLVQHENPNWYSVPEEEVYRLLKSEGLPVLLREDKFYL